MKSASLSETGMQDFRGADPNPDGDPSVVQPAAEDNHSAPAPGPAAGGDDQGAAPKRDDEAPARPAGPPKGPFDDRRMRAAERFSRERADHLEEDPPNPDFVNPGGVYGPLAGPPGDGDGGGGADSEQDDPKAPAKPGPSDSGSMTLTVRGRTINKTMAEVASLADMTVEEVQADPRRAIRYAQKEMAGDSYLEEAKRSAGRDTPSRPRDDRQDAAAPNQDQDDAGDDDLDQPQAGSDTSDPELTKLIEDIQIGDPKDVAPKLQAAMDKATETAQQRSEARRAFDAERQSNANALKGFLADHTELQGKNSIAAAVSSGLVDEYRIDLRKAMVSTDGLSADEADEALARATPDQVRNAHLARRLARDPNVRVIDKALFETALSKVRSDFGVTGDNSLASTRQARKDALQHQPRRASVPPATQRQEAPTRQSRREVVAEMATRTGRKSPKLG
jgi:hypothetical protein